MRMKVRRVVLVVGWGVGEGGGGGCGGVASSASEDSPESGAVVVEVRVSEGLVVEDFGRGRFSMSEGWESQYCGS